MLCVGFRLADFAVRLNRVTDENSWPAAEIFEKLALTAVIEGEKIDEPNLVVIALAQANAANTVTA